MPPARGLEPDVRMEQGFPVSADPITPAEPVEPPVVIEPVAVGADEELGSDKGREVKAEARELAQDGMESAKHVGSSAKREAGAVAEDVKEQASSLFAELGADVNAHAATQQEKISVNLRQISEELRNMLDSSEASGTASSLVDQAARHSGNAADWLESREPGDLLDYLARL